MMTAEMINDATPSALRTGVSLLPSRRRVLPAVLAGAALLSGASFAAAQGILTVTPGRSAATAAGNGTAGYSGDGSAATSATLAKPSAVAYDASGNLYIADANNHVVREVVKSSGNITTVAGTGVEGFAGDGGAATSAQLDTPTGIAIDGSGNLYIADSHNHRIRMVSGGNISTVAGTGTKGFSGDGAAATAANLSLPSGVAVDASGNLYIADTGNHRIRKVTSGTISTIAGDGEELFAGDGGAATAAALDSPTGVAVDSTGNVYIADRLNQRIRVVSTGGTITTLAGSGGGFSGGFSGDGASATAATLAKPTGVSVDAAGNVYIADTNNQAVRQVGGGVIGTIEGTGNTQGFAGDGGLATGAILNAPKAVATDASGNLAVADTLNQRVRSGALPTLAFGATAVGVNSAIQTVTLANTGTAPITVSNIAFTGAFTTVSGGSCSATPIALAPGASCTQNIAFLPAAVGAANGNVTFGGAGDVPESILLTGTGVQSSTTTTLVATATLLLATQSVTLTATIKPQGLSTPALTGTVSYFVGGTAQVGSAVPVASNMTALTTPLPVGSDVLTAVYSGDPNYAGSTSNQVAVLVEDFNFALNLTGGCTGTLTVEPGHSVSCPFTINPVNGAFNFPITFSATGLPAGATATFNPPTVTPGSSPASDILTITVPPQAELHKLPGFERAGGIVVAIMLLPFAGRLRRKARGFRPLTLALFLLAGLGATLGLTGCGSTSGFFGQSQKSYTVTITGTATSGGTTLQHSTTVTLTVE